MSLPPALIRLVKIAVCTAATLGALFVCFMAYIFACTSPDMGGAGVKGPTPCEIIFSDLPPTTKEKLEMLGHRNP